MSIWIFLIHDCVIYYTYFSPYLSNQCRYRPQTNIKLWHSMRLPKKINKPIEEKRRKSTWHGSFSSLAVLRVPFSKKQKSDFRYGLGECVNQISGLYRFSFVRRSHTNQQTHIYTSELKKTHSASLRHVYFDFLASWDWRGWISEIYRIFTSELPKYRI